MLANSTTGTPELTGKMHTVRKFAVDDGLPVTKLVGDRRFPSGRSSLKIVQRQSLSSRRRESVGYVLTGIPDYAIWSERLYLEEYNEIPLQLRYVGLDLIEE